jgi:predicted nucleic acid-binding protein
MRKTIVTNTTPLIALTAATGSLDVLKFLYSRVIVPLEVQTELRAAGLHAVGVQALNEATWLD